VAYDARTVPTDRKCRSQQTGSAAFASQPLCSQRLHGGVLGCPCTSVAQGVLPLEDDSELTIVDVPVAVPVALSR